MMLDGKETEAEAETERRRKVGRSQKFILCPKINNITLSNVSLSPTYFCLHWSKSEMIKKKQKNEMKLMEKRTNRQQVV